VLFVFYYLDRFRDKLKTSGYKVKSTRQTIYLNQIFVEFITYHYHTILFKTYDKVN